MSNVNNENTKPIKPLSKEDTQPTQIDESWLKPVADDGATVPVPVTRKGKLRNIVSRPVTEEGATVPIATTRSGKNQQPTRQPANDEEATLPVKLRDDKEAQTETPPSHSEPMTALEAGDEFTFAGEPDTVALTGTNGDADVPGETEPPPGRIRRGKWIWLGILGMLIIMLIGAGVGYASAIRARLIEQQNQRLVTATTQFELGLVDQRENRLETARQRFEYVLEIYPEFPGIADKLVEVGLAIGQTQGGPVVAPSEDDGKPDTVTTPVPTKDTTSVSVLFNQAQNQLKARDWEGLFTTIEKMRYIDPEYEAVKVDGMLYMALRNRGITQIQAGHLEPGLYSFALASQIAPLFNDGGLYPIDKDVEGYAAWASRYLKASSYGMVEEFLDDAIAQFAELYRMVPSMRDASGMTVTQRYAQSLIYMGDYYQRMTDYCGAVSYYQQAASIYALPALAEKIPEAEGFCVNPPEIVESTPEPTKAPEVVQPTTTEATQAVAPTEEPTPEPTDEVTPEPASTP